MITQPVGEVKARWLDMDDSRKIVRRVVVEGLLTLKTPARFGGGEGVELTDMPLARDPQENKPLLAGASIAGAARNYLREWEFGYGKKREAEPEDSLPRILFGDMLEEQAASQESWLTVDDALAGQAGTEIRPGVSIDPATRIARPKHLYDIELLEAGAQFPLHFELALPADLATRQKLLQGLAIALTGFERGEIGLGARKRRGLGECEVKEWKVWEYDLTSAPGLVAWLEGQPGEQKAGENVAGKLGQDLLEGVPDLRRRFIMSAVFQLETSLLIRSGGDLPDAPDMVHLKSRRGGKDVPILSGTSLAGALRGRALRIAKTLLPEKQATQLVEQVFGPEMKAGENQQKWASRVVVHEQEIQNAHEHVQSRVKIDRFTGGTYPGALFEQQPVLGGKATTLQVAIELRDPQERSIGLLLHLLKDLWTGDLPVGGEASVGRGRLRGLKAGLVFQSPLKEEKDQWNIVALPDSKLEVDGKREVLERYAKSVGGAQ